MFVWLRESLHGGARQLKTRIEHLIMLPGKPILTFVIYAVLLRALDGWNAPRMFGWIAGAFVAYGLFLAVNYWGRVRPARMHAQGMAS